MDGTVYPSDLTDEQWALIQPLMPPSQSDTPKGGRPREVSLRIVVNGMLYLIRSGCQWRMLPMDFGPWPTVHHYYRTWRRDGTLQQIHNSLRERVRLAVGKEPTPSAAVLDSQSVKTSGKGGRVATTRARKSAAGSGILSSIHSG